MSPHVYVTITMALLLAYCLLLTMLHIAKAFSPTPENPTVVLKRPIETPEVRIEGSLMSPQRRKVLISVCVHGNEQCGWLALEQLSQDGYFEHCLDDKGSCFWSKHPNIERLTLVLANPQATQENKRFIDSNLNRIFDVPHHEQGYEHSLLNDLKQHIQESDWYLDIHSTSAPTQPFAIPLDFHPESTCSLESQSVAECLPVTFVLEDILDSLEGTTMHWAGRDPDKIAVVVECGQHDAPDSVETAKACIKEFIRLASFFSDQTLKTQPPEPCEGAIVLTCHDCQPVHHGFRYVSGSTPDPFSYVANNELIAYDDVAGEIRCHFQEGAYLIMPTAHSIVGEEAWFWGRPKSQKDADALHGWGNKDATADGKIDDFPKAATASDR